VKASQPVTFQLATAVWPMQLSRACCRNDGIPLGPGLPFRQTQSRNRPPQKPRFRSASFGFVHAAHRIRETDHPLKKYMRQSGAVFKPHAPAGRTSPGATGSPGRAFAPLRGGGLPGSAIAQVLLRRGSQRRFVTAQSWVTNVVEKCLNCPGTIGSIGSSPWPTG
jgi:hypothetical protein